MKWLHKHADNNFWLWNSWKVIMIDYVTLSFMLLMAMCCNTCNNRFTGSLISWLDVRSGLVSRNICNLFRIYIIWFLIHFYLLVTVSLFQWPNSCSRFLHPRFFISLFLFYYYFFFSAICCQQTFPIRENNQVKLNWLTSFNQSEAVDSTRTLWIDHAAERRR